jgi:ppGpp synthetase/RelA/SpoT-type nucleotidyltranferase
VVTGSAGTDLDDLRQHFLDDHPRFTRLRADVALRLRAELQRRGLVGVQVDARVKDVASFVKKALRKSYNSPWDDIRDKVGVRLTAMYAASIPQLEEMVRDLFTIRHYEDKRAALEPNRLDYLGSHFEASLPEENSDGDLADVVFEVQVHTAAEGLWAGISHELLYKAAESPSPEIARSLYRLLALVELFDLEVSRARSTTMEHPGFPEAVVLRELDRHFFALTAHRSDAKLSRVVINALRSLYSEEEIADYSNLLGSFVATHVDKLRGLYEDYLEDDRNPLMSQPESLLVFERLENNFQRVPVVWTESLPDSLLESFAAIWGTPIEVDG